MTKMSAWEACVWETNRGVKGIGAVGLLRRLPDGENVSSVVLSLDCLWRAAVAAPWR